MRSYQVFRLMKLTIFISILGLLTGCANMMNQLGYTPIVPAPEKACQHANVLITNLTQPINQRQYQLPDGQNCMNLEDVQAID